MVVKEATEQGAGADRVPRGETWRIFMLRVLLLPVLISVAAAQLERCAAGPAGGCQGRSWRAGTQAEIVLRPRLRLFALQQVVA